MHATYGDQARCAGYPIQPLPAQQQQFVHFYTTRVNNVAFPRTCRVTRAVVFMVGMALHFLSLGARFFFNDDDALGDESQALVVGGEAVCEHIRAVCWGRTAARVL